MTSRHRLSPLLSVFFLAVLTGFGCETTEHGYSVQEFEQLVADARMCEAGDTCVVVDTYCCPRAVLASMSEEVEQANASLVDAADQCLADCINPEGLTATCEAGTCAIEFPPAAER